MPTLEELPLVIWTCILPKLHTEDILNICDASLRCDYASQRILSYSIQVDNEDTLVARYSASRPRYMWVTINEQSTLLHLGIVKSFQFLGKVSSLNDLNTLVQGLVHLTELEIGWLNLEFGAEPLTWNFFPELRKLTLGGPGNSDRRDVNDYSFRKVLRNLDGLIGYFQRMHFPNLEILKIGTICHECRANMLADTLLNFLITHEKSLHGLSILLVHSDQEISRQYELVPDMSFIPDWDKRLSSLQMNLRNLYIHHHADHVYPKMTQLIRHLYLSPNRNCIESSVMIGPFHVPFPTNLIETSFKTLNTLALSIDAPGNLNCQVFERCVLLEKLIICASTFENRATSQLVNIAFLPRSLNFLKIVNFLMETEESALFVSEFPLLNILNLEGIGEEGTLGFKWNDFFRLMHRGLKEVGIHQGFNRISVEEALGSNDGMVLFTTLSLMRIGNKRGTSSTNVRSLCFIKRSRRDPVFRIYCPRDNLRPELFPDCLRVETWFRDPCVPGTYKLYTLYP